MPRFKATRFDQDSGQALVEYVLVISLIALAAVTGLGLMSGAINQIFTTIGNSIGGP